MLSQQNKPWMWAYSKNGDIWRWTLSGSNYSQFPIVIIPAQRVHMKSDARYGTAELNLPETDM